MFANCIGRPGFIYGSIHTKDSKWYLLSPCLKLSIIRCGSRASGAIQGKELSLPLHLGVVAVKKGAFGSLSTTVGQFTTFIYIYIYIYMTVVQKVLGFAQKEAP